MRCWCCSVLSCGCCLQKGFSNDRAFFVLRFSWCTTCVVFHRPLGYKHKENPRKAGPAECVGAVAVVLTLFSFCRIFRDTTFWQEVQHKANVEGLELERRAYAGKVDALEVRMINLTGGFNKIRTFLLFISCCCTRYDCAQFFGGGRACCRRARYRVASRV